MVNPLHPWEHSLWRGLGFGGGVFYVGHREATLPNSFQHSAHTRIDATLFYERERWKAQLNLRNLFDKQYVIGGTEGVYAYTVAPGAPRTLLATLMYRF